MGTSMKAHRFHAEVVLFPFIAAVEAFPKAQPKYELVRRSSVDSGIGQDYVIGRNCRWIDAQSGYRPRF